MTDTERGRQLIQRAGGGRLVDLARAVAPAVFVEPGLLRQVRLALLPGAGVGVESDLWFSPLVLTRNTTGIVLDPDVLAVLREQLAHGDADFAERACGLVRELHEHYPATLRLEEELVWEAIRLNGTGRIEEKLRPAVKALTEHPDGGSNVARWAAQAWHRLPELVRETEAAQLLAVASSLRIGRVIGTARPGDHALPVTSLAWLRPSSESRPDYRIGLRLAIDGLRFVAPEGERFILQLPPTTPPVVEVGWNDEGVRHQRVVPATEDTAVQLGNNATNIVLRALDGRKYLVRPRGRTTAGGAIIQSQSDTRSVIQIFVSYRSDDGPFATALMEDLSAYFGPDVVFRSSRSISPGEDYGKAILHAIRQSSVMLVLIGPRWLIRQDESGRRKLHNPDDWVRREIAAAFEYGVRVIPILLNATRLHAEELPPEIGQLARFQFLRMGMRNFHVDIMRLRAELSSLVPELTRAERMHTPTRSHEFVNALLALPDVHLVVDGYNVTKTGYPELTLSEQRERLVHQLAVLSARTGAEVTVVFDGAGVVAVPTTVPRGVRVLFSDPGVLAADVIRALVTAGPEWRPGAVVTSDQAVADSVWHRGIHLASPTELLAYLDQIEPEAE